jgi:acetolactate synthase-1/2/3 large subunit
LRAVDALVETLASCGVKYVFGLPGNSLLEATDYMNESGVCEFVTVRHEQVAAAMAEGFARVTGKPGVCVAGAGPSAANLVIGVANALRASSPMLVLTGNLPRTKLGREIYNEWDQMGVFKPITKLSFQATEPQLLHSQIKSALLCSISGRPGPVHVDIPHDVGIAEIEHPPKPNSLALEPTRLGAKPEDIQKTVELIVNSECPVIIAGGGAVYSRAEKSLKDLIEMLGIPLVLTTTSRGLISEEHPLCFGGTGVWGFPAANDLVGSSDLVVGLGCRFGDDATIDWTSISHDAKIIQVDIDANELGKHYDLDLGILADVDTFLQQLVTALKGMIATSGKYWPQSKLALLQSALKKDRMDFYDSPISNSPVDKKAIIREIQKQVANNAIIMSGTGVHARYVAKLIMKEPRCLHKSGGFAAMGFAFPAAMGAKMALPDRQVICLDGDGDFMMTVQDLETAVRLNLKFLTVVFNNQSYAAYEIPKGRRSVEFTNPDFPKLAESFGAVAADVKNTADFGPVLKEMLKADVPAIINAVVTRESEIKLWPGQSKKM